MKKIKYYLEKKRAPFEAIKWCGNRKLQECWDRCPVGNWMLWLMFKNPTMCDEKTFTLAKARCAELLKYDMKDERSLNALKMAFAFSNGEITGRELYIAAVDAANAADAVSESGNDDRDYIAAYAAYAAAYDCAYNVLSSRVNSIYLKKKCADICREVLKNPKIKGIE